MCAAPPPPPPLLSDANFFGLRHCYRDCGLNLPIYVKPSVSFNGASGHIDIMVVSMAAARPLRPFWLLECVVALDPIDRCVSRVFG